MNVHKNYLNVLIKLRPTHGLSLDCETGGTTPVHNVLSVVNIKDKLFSQTRKLDWSVSISGSEIVCLCFFLLQFPRYTKVQTV